MTDFVSHPASSSLDGPEARPVDAARPGSAGRWRMAFMLAALSLLAGILLTSVSVWFLGAVALAGAGSAAISFDFHTPGALVRLFAITRTAARYGERLSGHAAALGDQVALRLALFRSMAAAPATRAAGWQLGREDRLADWLDDVEDRDDERLRVQFPLATLAFGFALLLAATVFVTPLASVAIVLAAVLLVALAGHVARSLAQIEGEARSARRAGSAALGAALQALVPLTAEDLRKAEIGVALRPLRDAQSLQRRQADRLAALDFAVSTFGPFALMIVLVGAFSAGASGEALLPAAFVGFGWLALGEAGGVASKIVLGRVKAVAARANLAVWSADDALPVSSDMDPFAAIDTIALQGLRTATPDGRLIGRALDLSFQKGRPTALTGTSGAGKTTLLKTIAGWLEPAAGAIRLDGLAVRAEILRGQIHLGLHDAAILSDTVRANLFADEASEAEIDAALAAVEMRERIAEGGGLDAWITQDRLSLGEAQRLNLARAFLTRAPVILVDEPTEHLDAEQAVRILARLRNHCAGRILVYSAHRPPLIGDAVVKL